MAALQDEQGGEIKESRKRLHRGPDKNDERREQRQRSADRLEQVIEEKRPRDVEGHAQHGGCEPRRNRPSFARMLPAVAAASPWTTTLPMTNTWPNADVVPSSASKTPITLAVARGEVWRRGLVMTAVLTLISFPNRGRGKFRYQLSWNGGY